MIYLRELIKRRTAPEGPGYPMGSPILKGFTAMAFDQPVTILCGENGSGKTTLMALLAAGLSAQMVGADGVQAQKLKGFRQAARYFDFVKNKSPSSCFFFTAEDFSRYLDQRQQMAQEAREGLREIEEGYLGRSQYAKGLAAQPYARTLWEMEGQYDRELLASSHGEGFLSFFAGRLRAGGLYLMDEPEGALSFPNQLSLLALIDQAVIAGGQVIMATHSPVLTAYPNAALLELTAGGMEKTSYEQLSSIQFLRHFLAHREGILRRAGIETISRD